MIGRVLTPEWFRRLVRPRWRPVGLFAAVYGLAVLVTLAVTRIVAGRLGPDTFEAQQGAFLAGLALALAVVLLLARSDFGLRSLLSFRGRWTPPLLGIVAASAYFALQGVLLAGGETLRRLSDFLQSAPYLGAAKLGLAALLGGVWALAGALEEVLFRGIVQTSCHAHLRPVPAVVMTAVLFAAPHAGWGWINATDAFAFGLALSWYRYSQGSLVLPVAVHAWTNFLYGLLWVAGH